MEMIQKLRSSGVFWMITSACAFSLMQVFIKLTSASVSVYLQVLFRNVVGILISAIYIKKEQLLWFGSKQEQLFLFGRSIAGFLGLVTFFYASRLGNVADVTIVNRTGPFFTTLFSVIFLKERASKEQWFALSIVFLGGLIAANPSFGSSPEPMLLALLSAVMNGSAYTLLAHFRDRVPAMTVVMHFSVFSVAASLPFVIYEAYLPTIQDICMLSAIAVTGSLGLISITLAYRLAPATEISIYDQLGTVMSVLLGWAILKQVPKCHTLIGAAVVIAASVWMYCFNRKNQLRIRSQH